MAVRPKKEKKGPLDNFLINGPPIVRRTHKYGIELPKPGKYTIEHARKLDQKNGDSLYMTALKKRNG
jgi:hypothetical protein